MGGRCFSYSGPASCVGEDVSPTQDQVVVWGEDVSPTQDQLVVWGEDVSPTQDQLVVWGKMFLLLRTS